MPTLVYRNTRTTLPGWVTTIHESQPRGIAYETDTHFVHFYGVSSGLWVVSPGLTATQKKEGTLQDWVVKTFGAEESQESIQTPGVTVFGVWRPGLSSYGDITQGLATSHGERHSAVQALRLLLERLDELLLYIEPNTSSLETYSHKSRELLILACTEVENSWKNYMDAAGLGRDKGGTKDYVKLVVPLFLSEYEITFKPLAEMGAIRPFLGWSASHPTQSLSWYHSYNLTKHDRQSHFSEATLKHCLHAVCANLVMFCVRFSPLPLYDEGTTISRVFRHLFDVAMRDCSPTTFYVPLVKIPPAFNPGLICFDSGREKLLQPWTVKPFDHLA